jgi:hypothetical protein
MNYLRPFKTCFCGKHVLDLSRHRPRLRFERRSKFSSRSTAPLPGRMRNSPSPKGERRPSHVIGNAVHVMRIATGEIEDTKATPRTEAPKGRLEGRQSPPRHDPIRVFAKEVHRQNAAKAGRTIADHLMGQGQIPSEHSAQHCPRPGKRPRPKFQDQSLRRPTWSARHPAFCRSSRSGSPEASWPPGPRARGRCEGARSLTSRS